MHSAVAILQYMIGFYERIMLYKGYSKTLDCIYILQILI